MFDNTAPLAIELSPEFVLPSQFYAGVRNDASLSAEKRLMLAVLGEALGDYQGGVDASDGPGERAFRDAEAWFESGEEDWPFSFVNICQALGIDADYVRSGLRRWRDAHRAAGRDAKPVIRIQLRRVAGIRSRATGRPLLGRARARG
jgi:hypothetical protein